LFNGFAIKSVVLNVKKTKNVSLNMESPWGQT